MKLPEFVDNSSTAQEAAQCCMCGKKGLSTVEGDGGGECQLWDDRWTCSRACYDIAYSLAHPTQPSVSVAEAIASKLACTIDDIDGLALFLRSRGLKSKNSRNAGRLMFAADVIAALEAYGREREREGMRMAADKIMDRINNTDFAMNYHAPLTLFCKSILAEMETLK